MTSLGGIEADRLPGRHQLGQVGRDRAWTTPDVEEGQPRPQVGKEVGRGVLRRAPGVAAQYRLVVPMGVSHENIVPRCPSFPKCRRWPNGSRTFVGGRALEKADLLSFSSLKTFSPQVEELYGQTLDAITRRAKYLVWGFAGGTRIIVHLSQAGRVDVESPPKTTRPRGSVVRFTFSGPAPDDR